MAKDSVTITIAGFDDLYRELSSLPADLQTKLSNFALRKGGNIVRDSMRRAAPVRRTDTDQGIKRISARSARGVRRPGFLKQNIKVRRARRGSIRKFGSVTYYVTPESDAFYGRILSGGSKYRGRGWSKSRNWIQRSWLTVASKTEAEIATQYEKALIRRYNVKRPPRKKRAPRG